ncbi:MAG: hypothetical protein JW809_13110 [Pirellulales bacterium]|nr:hypothetical protein [Pirellulales bacterium]
MDINPYQSPDYFEVVPANCAVPESAPRVDGRCLVVRSGTVLPPVCVKTNQPVSNDEVVRQDFYWCSPWVLLLIFVNLLVLLIAYLIARKKCALLFGLQRTIRRRYRRRLLIKITVMVVSFVGCFYAGAADAPVLIVIALCVFAGALISLCIGQSPLKIRKHRDGWFWVQGCCVDYLTAIQQAE